MMIGTSLQSLGEFIVLTLTLLLISLEDFQVLCAVSAYELMSSQLPSTSLARPMKSNDRTVQGNAHRMPGTAPTVH